MGGGVWEKCMRMKEEKKEKRKSEGGDGLLKCESGFCRTDLKRADHNVTVNLVSKVEMAVWMSIYLYLSPRPQDKKALGCQGQTILLI